MANADRIIDLLHEAKARPEGAEREQFLAEACGDDAALKEQIVSLLQADAADGESDFLKITRIIRQDITPTEKPGDRIGRYKLLEQIGEGGCGVVYVAEQQEPVRRRVALKVIKLGMDTKQVIARFDAERQALAIMDHPNIAKVLDAGATGTGRPYFVMELVRGIKITDYCDQHQLSPRERLELFIQVCRAIQHAHQKGVMHRDIKPSNILVASNDGAPVPKVIDFGIAKATQGRLTDQTIYTAFEQFIGTPAYMSPEQAEMSLNDVDTRTDIYSLGVLLYELLTGKTPFDATELVASGLEAMRRTIREKEPARPSTRLSTMMEGELTSTARQRHTEAPRLIHLLRGDLDWIVMKCLEKDRTRRYETASGLAMDIQRHLGNEPVVARPPSKLYEFQKTVRRHKVGFVATAAVILALAAGMLASVWEAGRARQAEQARESEAERARQEAARARQTEAEANEKSKLARESADEARRQQHLASEQELLARRRYCAAQMNLANQALEAGDVARALDLLASQRPQNGQEDLRTFDWYHLWGRCNAWHAGSLCGETSPVTCLTFSPDGKTLASASMQGTIRLWDVASAFERLLFTNTSATAVAFTPDGQTLISVGGDHLVRLWDLARGQVRATFRGHTSWVRALAVAPDGKTVVTGDQQGIVKLWEASTGHEKASVVHPDGHVIAAAFSPDGNRLAIASGWGTNAVLWDLASGVPQHSRLLSEDACSLAFSPDGSNLAAGMILHGIRIYDAASSEPQIELRQPWRITSLAAYLPDGKTLVASFQDRSVGLWQLPSTNQPTARSTIIGAHLERVLSLAASGDGKMLASGANDGSIELWDLSRTQEQLDSQLTVSFKVGGGLKSLVFSPDGRTLFAGTEHGTSLIDAASGLSYARLPDATSFGALSSDGRLLATADSKKPGPLRLWDAATHRLLGTVEGYQNRATAVAFSPDGRTLASGGWEQPTVGLWDATTLKLLRTIVNLNGPIGTLAFSQDGRTLAVGTGASSVKLFDPQTGQEKMTFNQDAGNLWIRAIAFSHDGKIVAAGGEAGIVTLWDVQTAKLRTALKGHTGAIYAIAFSTDDRIVATSSSDRAVRIWDTATAQERITLNGFEDVVTTVAFAPDGSILAAGSNDGRVRLWRTNTVPLATDHGPGQKRARGD